MKMNRPWTKKWVVLVGLPTSTDRMDRIDDADKVPSLESLEARAMFRRPASRREFHTDVEPIRNRSAGCCRRCNICRCKWQSSQEADRETMDIVRSTKLSDNFQKNGPVQMDLNEKIKIN